MSAVPPASTVSMGECALFPSQQAWPGLIPAAGSEALVASMMCLELWTSLTRSYMTVVC